MNESDFESCQNLPNESSKTIRPISIYTDIPPCTRLLSHPRQTTGRPYSFCTIPRLVRTEDRGRGAQFVKRLMEEKAVPWLRHPARAYIYIHTRVGDRHRTDCLARLRAVCARRVWIINAAALWLRSAVCFLYIYRSAMARARERLLCANADGVERFVGRSRCLLPEVMMICVIVVGFEGGA